MFGSALTLASFMKLIHAVFLGQPANKQPRSNEALTKAGTMINKRRETSPTMWIPQVFLAVLCVIFGVFAYRIPLKMFIFPSLEEKIEFFGIWNASLATILIIVGVAVGIIVYLLGTIRKTREAEAFIGGEILEKQPNMRVSGTEFYNTIKNIRPLSIIYKLAERKVFDIYDIGSIITFRFNKILRYIHNGVLLTYLAWCFLGMIILFYILLR
jgi:NADH:ubiquinone oxidoreductase subunit 5 (subunit L)/multisubunit Na+/H+ antiporter MnhA subunit